MSGFFFCLFLFEFAQLHGEVKRWRKDLNRILGNLSDLQSEHPAWSNYVKRLKKVSLTLTIFKVRDACKCLLLKFKWHDAVQHEQGQAVYCTAYFLLALKLPMPFVSELCYFAHNWKTEKKKGFNVLSLMSMSLTVGLQK